METGRRDGSENGEMASPCGENAKKKERKEVKREEEEQEEEKKGDEYTVQCDSS
jgi:hypothetical protein